MKKLGLSGKIEEIDLNGHKVIALVPKRQISYTECVNNIKKILNDEIVS